MKYVSYEETLIIHARIVDAAGGAHGVRDVGIISSAVARPKMQFGGRDLYPNVFEKAAAYFESIALGHPFIDGNKRTAIALAARFLFLNGFEITATNRTLEDFVLDAVVEKYTIKKVADWLKKHSVKI